VSEDASLAVPKLPTAAYGAVISGAIALLALWGLGVSGALGRSVTPFFGDAAPGLLALAMVGWLPPPAPAARAVACVMLYVIGFGLAAVKLGLASATLGAEGAPSATLGFLTLGLLALLAAPTILLARAVRRALARWLPLRPDVFRHWVGLVVLVWFTLMPLALLPLLGGQPPLAAVVERLSDEELAYSPWGDVASLLWSIGLCIVATGFPLVRSGPAVRDRLGLRWPGWRRIAVGVGLSLLLVALVFVVVVPLTDAVLTALGVSEPSGGYFEKLVGPVDVGGAVLRAVKAGIGEELVWRGLVQPRYGLVPAALGFAAMHGFQYGPSSLVVVLVLGICLGLVRRWSNTTAAIVVHGSYDLWLFLAVALGPLVPTS
jgi:uncharacterized protein